MELGNQFGSAIIVAYLLEALKRSPLFPLLSEENTRRYKIVMGGIAAFCVTVGIHYAFDYNATGHGVLMITLPTWPELSHALFDFAKQWAFQQGAYDSMVKSGGASPSAGSGTGGTTAPAAGADVSGHAITGP